MKAWKDTCWKLFLVFVAILESVESSGRREKDRRKTEYACEGATVNLVCSENEVIKIIRANYGRFSINVCNKEGIDWSNTLCQGTGTVAIMQERCEHKQTCSVEANNENFHPDPCPTIFKYLEVQFRCVAAPETTTTTTPASMESSTGGERPQEKITKLVVVVAEGVMSSKAVTRPAGNSEGKSPTEVGSGEGGKPTFCPEIELRNVKWPQTELGHITRQPCPNTFSEYAEWYCSQVGVWTPSKPDLSRCVSAWAKNLAKDSKDIDSSGAAMAVAERLQDRIRMNHLYGGDTVVAANVMETAVIKGREYMRRRPKKEKKQFASDLSSHLVKAGGYLLHETNREAWEDLSVAQRIRSATSILDSLEQNGVFLADSMNKDSNTESKQSASKSIVMEVTVVQVQDYVQFPSQSIWDRSVDWVQVPRSALTQAGAKGFAKTVFVSHQNLGDYMTPVREKMDVDGKIIEVERKVVSNIVTANIGSRRPIRNLKQPVVITMATEKDENLSNPTCVFWDKTLGTTVGRWSSKGCKVVKSNDTHTVCACNHLTNFAVLMDVRGLDFSWEHTIALSFITYTGCVISIVCLFLAILAFCIMRGSSSDRVTIHINLCFCLLIAELVFIFGIAQTQHEILCSVVAGLLHYFFLAAFSWMLLEGFQLYALLVEVFETENSRKKWFYLFGYGIPLVIVGISLGVDYDSYGTAKYCWLRTDNYFVLSFVGPVIVVIAANSVLLAMAMVIMCRHSHVSIGYRHCRHKNTLENMGVWIKGAVALVFLLGLTWAFGILYINEKSAGVSTRIYEYLFTILNSFQGLFIFLFHVVLNDKMRKEYRKWVRRSDWLPDCLREPSLVECKPVSGLQKIPNSSSRCLASSPISPADSTSAQSCLTKFLHMNGMQARYNSSAQLLLGKQGFYNNDSRYEYAFIQGTSESSEEGTVSSPCSMESNSFSPHFISFPVFERRQPPRPPPNFPPPAPPYCELIPDLEAIRNSQLDSDGKRPVSQKSSCNSTVDSAFSDGSSFRSANDGRSKVVLRRTGSKETVDGRRNSDGSSADFIAKDADLARASPDSLMQVYPSALELNSPKKEPKPEIPVCYKSAPNLKKAAAMDQPNLLIPLDDPALKQIQTDTFDGENSSLLSLPDLSYEIPKSAAMRFSPNLLSPLPTPGEQNVYASAQNVRPSDRSKNNNFRASCK